MAKKPVVSTKSDQSRRARAGYPAGGGELDPKGSGKYDGLDMSRQDRLAYTGTPEHLMPKKKIAKKSRVKYSGGKVTRVRTKGQTY